MTADRPATEPRRLSEQHWMLDDIADRDAQTKPITKPEDLPLGRDGTKYDHARWQASEYHLDTHSLALGDRHLLLREVRRLRAEAAQRVAPRAEGSTCVCMNSGCRCNAGQPCGMCAGGDHYYSEGAAPHEHEWTAETQPGPYLPVATCIAPGHSEGAAPRADCECEVR